MSFQWIIDNALDISINKRDIVAQSTARDNTIRSISRGGNIWRFTVTPSAGTFWQQSRGYIETIDLLNRITPATINFSKPEFKFIFGYQGSAPSTSGWQATVTKGAMQFTTNNTVAYGYRYKKGDIIQFTGDDSVYTVTGDVAYNTTTVTVNRPIKIANGSYTLKSGQDCTFKVICSKLPNYTITPLGIITWDGTFEFSEYLV